MYARSLDGSPGQHVRPSSSQVYVLKAAGAEGKPFPFSSRHLTTTAFVNEFTYPGEVRAPSNSVHPAGTKVTTTAAGQQPSAPGAVEEEPMTRLDGQRMAQIYTVRKTNVTHINIDPDINNSSGSLHRRKDIAVLPSRMDTKELAPTYKLSDDTLKQYQEAFRIFDRNGDGSITCQELGTVMKSLGNKPSEAELQDMINEVDVDGSGTIEFDEFVQMMARRLQEKGDEDGDEELKEAFEVFDRNKDGFITTEELRLVMSSLGENLTEQELNEMMKAADANGDGIINFNEFQEVWMEARQVASNYSA